MIVTPNTDIHLYLLKITLNVWELEVNNLRIRLADCEKAPRWLIFLRFWQSKRDVLNRLRLRIRFLDKDIQKLRIEISTYGKPAPTRSVQS